MDTTNYPENKFDDPYYDNVIYPFLEKESRKEWEREQDYYELND